MDYKTLQMYIYEMNEDEKFYKNYYFAKQQQYSLEKFLAELDFEDVGKILFDDSNGQVSMVITLLFDDSSLVNVSKILFREEITPNPDESSEDEETAVPNNAVKPIIRVEKGKIESNQPFEIYNILGMKVTSRNGFLPKGVYLVVFENDVLKTLVR